MCDEAAGCLRTVAHPVRLAIVDVLVTHGPLPVGVIAKGVGLPVARASEHLRLMRDRGLLYSRRNGREVHYGVAEEGLRSILDCVRHRFASSPENLDAGRRRGNSAGGS